VKKIYDKHKGKRRMWAVDCETDPFAYGDIVEPFIWGVYDGYSDLYWEFTDTDKMVDFLIEHDVIVYAHNGGKFDWHFITHRLDPDNPLLIIAGRLAKFKIGKCDFRDSISLMPIALAQYSKMEFEYWKLHKLYRAQYMDEIKTYLRSDCVNLWNLVNGFEQEYGRHITQASAAMKIWAKMSGHTPPRSGVDHYDTFHPYYYGGRVQCFVSGDIEVSAHSADINSAYPNAMLDEHPYGFAATKGDGTPPDKVKDYGPMFFRIDAVSRGAFPYFGTDGKLYFPADDELRVYTVTGWELLAALETNTVEQLEIRDYWRFGETINFRDYVHHFWNVRKQAKADGDTGRALYAKIFMNALYGKFAANPRKYMQHTLMDPSKLAEVVESMQRFDFFNEWLLVQKEIPPEKHRYYNVATAASITGHVRAKLWRAICDTERPLYCDTDSITSGGPPSQAIKIGTELGEWEIESYYDRIIIGGKKLYAFHKRGTDPENNDNWKVASKGARLTAKQIIRLAGGEEIIYKPDVPTYSVHKSGPRFIDRVIRVTASDITQVPRAVDPKYAE